MSKTGRNSAIGYGEESTWGTAVARAVWNPVRSMDGKRKITKTPRAHLVGGSGVMRRSHFTSSDRSEGRFEVDLTYRNIGTWLKHLLGVVSTSGTGPYAHALTLGELAAGNPGITLEMIRGNATNSEVFEGVKVKRGRISIPQGGVGLLAIEWMGQTAATRAAAGSVTLPTADEPVLHDHAGQFGHDGNNYDLISMDLQIDRKLGDRQLLGSAETKEPVHTDFFEVTGTLELEYTSDVLYTAFLADTQVDGTITFTGAGNSSMAFTLQNMYIEDVSEGISGPGKIRQVLKVRMESDGTDEGFKIVSNNDDSDVDAAS